MEKRTLLAIALSFLVLFGFQYISQKIWPPAEKPAIVHSQVAESQESPTPSTAEVADEAPVPLMEIAESDTSDDGPREVIIRGDLYHAVVDSKGAVIESWILNDFLSSHKDPLDRVPYEMIAAGEGGEKWSHPGSLYFDDPVLSALANDEIYEVTVDGRPYSGTPLKAPVDVILTLRRGDLAIEKTYRFNEDNYTVDLSASFEKGGRELEGSLLIGQDIGPEVEYERGRYTQLQAIYYNGEKVNRESAPDDEEGVKTISGNIRWVGLEMHYFGAIVIPKKPFSSFDIHGFQIESTNLQGKSTDRKLLSLKTPVDGSFDCQLYLGPKKQDKLKAVSQYDLSEVINYGWPVIRDIARFLMTTLRWVNQYTNNYGYAIILLTLIISLLLFPLRLKQMASMKKMQVIQPQVKAIQEKYKKYKKTDPKRAEMNQEIMALYKTHKVNPMGGCLPMIPQMPILFAFYQLLAHSIELRHAPFIWWLQDLSAKDPYYVVPIVMGISMFLSQKLTPMAPTSDNPQMKIMKYLPIVFIFIFKDLSSGLNLYFLCSNIFQVGFQKIAEVFMGDGKKKGNPKQKKKNG